MKNFASLILLFTISNAALASPENVYVSEGEITVKTSIDNWPSSLWPGMSYEVMKSYLWMQQMQMTNGLLESAENTNFISLYDNALASLVFMAQGELSRAEKIFDFFNGRLESEFKCNRGGFYQFRNAMGDDGSRIWIGDNAWLLIALNHYQSLTGNDRYAELAQALDQWIRKMQHRNGSIRGGKDNSGDKIPIVTEGMITAFIAVKGYDKFHSRLLGYLKKHRWDEQNKLLVAWPENPHYKYALDLHSLSSLIFPAFPENALYDSSRFYVTTHSFNGEISGFCFDEDKDVIWYEGTAQMALAFNRKGLKKQANFLLSELQKGIITSPFNRSLGGLPYTSNTGSSYGSSKLWDHADKRAALSSNAWLYFASVNFNPLNQGAAKIIPKEDQFWNE